MDMTVKILKKAVSCLVLLSLLTIPIPIEKRKEISSNPTLSLSPTPTQVIVSLTPAPTLEPTPTPTPTPTLAPTPTPTQSQWVSLGVFRITAYCPCRKCSGKWGYRTSSGARATEGRTIAVDPKTIPYGTKLKVNGHEYIAEDTGSAIRSNRLDIFFESHQQASNWGVQYLEVWKFDE